MQYGQRIAALVVYLANYQLLPEKPVAEVLAVVFGVNPVTSTIAQMSRSCAHRYLCVADAICRIVAAAPVKSADAPIRPTDKSVGLICDHTIALDGHVTRQHYPAHLRRIRFKDPETGKTLVFLANQMTLPALTICTLYKSRWQVELFFVWIKQHLRIKQFYGTSENAVKTQIWIAVSVYVLVAIVRKRLKLEASLYTFLQVISVTSFEKIELQSALSGTPYRSEEATEHNQSNLFSY